MVEQVIASVVGGSFTEATSVRPICTCTKFTHEEVKDAIGENNLTTVAEAMAFMEWKGEGCHICRPALNYYVQLFNPFDTEDDGRSRVANERFHGNIQKDGTFSVIPRVYGGVTTPEELIRIGEVAKKYEVPTVKFTGGQRVDLLGVKKSDLIPMWEDLDMPSGYAYGKALRTVKTCVGKRWCRFGTQDSMELGILLEKLLHRVWAPAKVKLAVSGCPRNCAEASIKDLGVVGIEGGFELYVGGNGGVKVRAADLLCKVEDESEVIEITKAYLQYYREDARYGERTATWIERAGLDGVVDRVVTDSESRANLAKSLDAYLETLKTDPWSRRIESERAGDKGTAIDYRPIEVNEEASSI